MERTPSKFGHDSVPCEARTRGGRQLSAVGEKHVFSLPGQALEQNKRVQSFAWVSTPRRVFYFPIP